MVRELCIDTVLRRKEQMVLVADAENPDPYLR
jgi:hypothetical protein